jgi:pseudaminic acid cytidylyltransferase
MSSPSAVAVIPARGGSKRIPRKNVRPFLGTPLIARTAEAVLGTGLFNQVVVSTDDEEIASVAASAGADISFVRPATLSDDFSGTREVIQHAIAELESRGRTFDLVCSIYATAVLLRPADLKASRDSLISSQANFVFSATTFAYPVQRALRVRDDGSVAMLQPEHRVTRSQDLEEAYHDAGQFYWGTRDAWMSGASIFGGASRIHHLPRWRVQDIDTMEDWERAEMMVRVAEMLFKAQGASGV